MGTRGPARTPTPLLRLSGSRRAAERTNEPAPRREPPEMPAWVAGDAAGLWDQLSGVLDAMGVLTVADGYALGRYCVLFAEWLRCKSVVEARGVSYQTANKAGELRHAKRPEAAMLLELGTQLSRFEMQFGLTPSGRSGINLAAGFTSAMNDGRPSDMFAVPSAAPLDR